MVSHTSCLVPLHTVWSGTWRRGRTQVTVPWDLQLRTVKMSRVVTRLSMTILSDKHLDNVGSAKCLTLLLKEDHPNN